MTFLIKFFKERVSFKGWYFEIIIKDRSRSWIGWACWPVMVIEDKDNDLKLEARELRTRRHEKTHLIQQVELLLLPFAIIYGLEYLFKGYRNISFEREAYENADNPEYLKTRKPYAWLKYL